MQNLLACRPASYRQYENLAFAHLAEIGVKHVEVAIPAVDEIPGTLDALKQHGITVSSTQADLNIHNPNIARDFAAVAEGTRKMGAKHIFVSVKADDMDRTTAYGRLRAVGETCARHDVTVVMETHPDLITNGDVARRTMEGVDHPNIRVNWDTANVYYYNEGIDGVEEMRKVIDFIGAVHLKDTSGGFKTWYFPALGEGVVDFPRVYRELNAKGFYGPFTMELEGIEGENLTEEGAKERVATSVRYLRGIGVLG
ncbi:sugar phosphate isomerase/epimerase [Candidatus Poribacteria bacterium]|jgi:L-ribulose-5-phosphate 3-epimerase|nr:sugar phosphate isomerase/epimerase [Candidatus Poribacteria bacterium]MBT5533970.1 sugar phosphate isomerase/epimerase [Candidatus Poribacteria bacterium]MBT5710115.1 sugar phosphate isomerase/epimerase [Candidatus Poribacteria bacterium]MBT7096539.1 sugar phosphate isomerase/epimerase [Candidatus Poribacteria bacterium]MBT7803934.1 sugar phosphate isomerase/epimerase [Candidatus Poribacteria bacterium]